MSRSLSEQLQDLKSLINSEPTEIRDGYCYQHKTEVIEELYKLPSGHERWETSCSMCNKNKRK